MHATSGDEIPVSVPLQAAGAAGPASVACSAPTGSSATAAINALAADAG